MSGIENQRQRITTIRASDIENALREACQDTIISYERPTDSVDVLRGSDGSRVLQRSVDVPREAERRGRARPTCERDAVALLMPTVRTLGRFRALVVPRALVGSGNLIGSRMIIIPRAVVLPRAMVALPALAVRALVAPRSLTRDLAIDDPDFPIGRLK